VRLTKDSPTISLNANMVHYKEIFISGAYGSTVSHHKKALELLNSGKIRAERYITHILPLEKIMEGIEIVKTGEGLKVVLVP
jgi:L-iditol 2-dehydrogenase